MVFLDVENLGESMGPNCQTCLRRKFGVMDKLLRKLLHGAMAGRGSAERRRRGRPENAMESLRLLSREVCDMIRSDLSERESRSPSGPFFPFWGLRFLIKLPNTKKGSPHYS